MKSNTLSITTEADMKIVGLTAILSLVVVIISAYIYRWRNPKSRGVLPPGSSGLPLIGETIQLILPNPTIDLPPFMKNRMKWYGPIFRTNVAGRHAIISTDPEFNRFLLRRDGELIEFWPLDTFVQIFENDNQFLEKYFRKFVLHHFGSELIKDKLLPNMEGLANETLREWSTQNSVEVKGAFVTLTINLAMKQLFSGDLEISPLQLGGMFRDIIQGLMTFPLNLPGTTHHRCIKIHKKVKRLIKDVVQKRFAAATDGKDLKGDLLDHVIDDMTSEGNVNEDAVVQSMFSLLFVTSESISTTLALAMKLLTDHPAVVAELRAEHEKILRLRENFEGPLTWSEYKSMTFTIHVINEVLRLGSITPGLFRRALKDIPINGYVIPQGWPILIATSALHLDPDQFQDPLSFNPWRWKNIEASVVSKYFMPFGLGIRQCTGAEYSKAWLATFLHVMVTKYRWTLVKGGKIARAPVLMFPDGFHFKISKRSN